MSCSSRHAKAAPLCLRNRKTLHDLVVWSPKRRPPGNRPTRDHLAGTRLFPVRTHPVPARSNGESIHMGIAVFSRDAHDHRRAHPGRAIGSGNERGRRRHAAVSRQWTNSRPALAWRDRHGRILAQAGQTHDAIASVSLAPDGTQAIVTARDASDRRVALRRCAPDSDAFRPRRASTRARDARVLLQASRRGSVQHAGVLRRDRRVFEGRRRTW